MCLTYHQILHLKEYICTAYLWGVLFGPVLRAGPGGGRRGQLARPIQEREQVIGVHVVQLDNKYIVILLKSLFTQTILFLIFAIEQSRDKYNFKDHHKKYYIITRGMFLWCRCPSVCPRVSIKQTYVPIPVALSDERGGVEVQVVQREVSPDVRQVFLRFLSTENQKYVIFHIFLNVYQRIKNENLLYIEKHQI